MHHAATVACLCAHYYIYTREIRMRVLDFIKPSKTQSLIKSVDELMTFLLETPPLSSWDYLLCFMKPQTSQNNLW